MAVRAVTQETVFALRETIANIEGKGTPAFAAAEGRGTQAVGTRERQRRLSFGVEVLDEALEGGLPLDGLTEIRSSAMKDAAAASGFALAIAALSQNHQAEASPGGKGANNLPVLWIADRLSVLEAGLPYSLGLRDFGIAPQAFLHARPRKLEDALWLAEAAAASGAFATTILEISGNLKHFGLTESRRLNLRAKSAGRPLLILRQAGEEEASSAQFRFRIETAPAANRYLADGTMLGGSIGHSVFRLTLERSRNPAPFAFLLEWNSHDRRLLTFRSPAKSGSTGRPSTYPGAVLSKTVDRSGASAEMGPRLAFGRAS